jgi:hypothetical protein
MARDPSQDVVRHTSERRLDTVLTDRARLRNAHHLPADRAASLFRGYRKFFRRVRKNHLASAAERRNIPQKASAYLLPVVRPWTPHRGDPVLEEAIMEQRLLRLVIQEKIADGRLPSAPLPRVYDGRGTGQICDGCGEPVTQAQTVVENLDAGSRAARFHVACFHIWDVERQMAGPAPSARLPVRSGFRAPDARQSRPWAPSAPPARPASAPEATRR